ncbi:MAG: hypothetical protein ABSE73_02410 [Planctomycetota bacterium]
MAIVCVVLSACAGASEARPASQADVKQGLERGAALRNQTQLVPNVIQKYALITRAGGVRCGHAVVTIEDAKGEAGAVYRLREQFKAAVAGEGESALIDYSATFLLASDLCLLSGQMRTHSDLSNKGQNKHQDLVSQASVAIREDTLVWELSPQQEDGQAGTPQAAKQAKQSKKFPLHGVRPIPKNALFGLAAFALAGAKDGWQPDPKESLCVPTLDLGWEMDNFAVEAAWITFAPPALTDPKGSAARMGVRWLVAEIDEQGLEVVPPEPAVWLARQTWPLDAHCRPLAHPAPDAQGMTVECSDPETLDPNAPLDLEKIAAAMKANEPKEQK